MTYMCNIALLCKQKKAHTIVGNQSIQNVISWGQETGRFISVLEFSSMVIDWFHCLLTRLWWPIGTDNDESAYMHAQLHMYTSIVHV